MNEQPAIIQFSLDSVPEEDRLVTMREITGRAVFNLDIQPLTAQPELELQLWLLPGATVTMGRISPQMVRSGFDASLQDDDFVFGWEASPTPAQIEHAGRTVVFKQGTGLLLTGAEPYRSINKQVVHPRTIRLSRSQLQPLLPLAEDALMRPVSDKNPALRLLKAYVGTLKTTGPPETVELGHAVVSHLAELVALCLCPEADFRTLASSHGVRAARLAAAKKFVVENLQEAALSVNGVAAALRVTPRYVQMLFESEGTTFSAFVLGKRLALAYDWLGNPRLRSRSISDIAFDAGFGDLSYFNRAFRAEFDKTPSDVRQDR